MDTRDVEIGDVFMEKLAFEVYVGILRTILFLLVLAARCFSLPILVHCHYTRALDWCGKFFLMIGVWFLISRVNSSRSEIG